MARHLTANRLPFSYRGGGVLRRVPAGLKLLALFALSIAAFSSPAGLLIAALAAAAGSFLARVKPRELLRGSRSLFMLALFILVFQTFDPGAPPIALGAINLPWISVRGFLDGVLSALRIMVSFAAGSLLFAVTTMRELRLSLGRAEQAIAGLFVRPVAPRQYSRFSLGLSLMLGFIPRFFELWETVNLACDARSGRRGLRRLILIIPLTAERMMEMAATTAEALQARGI
jgi:biotin transport system permease protein